MVKKSVFAVSSLFISILALCSFVACSGVLVRVPGVHYGDWFLFSVGTFFDSNDTVVPPILGSLVELNKTEWLRVDVTGVNGTRIDFRETMHYENGTEQNYTNYQDVEGGAYSALFVAANLNAGDSLYSSGSYSSWIINDTVMTLYPSGLRQTNRVNITDVLVDAPGNFCSVCQRQYFDRACGVTVEIAWEGVNQTGVYYTEYSMCAKLIGSNLWIVPEYPSLAFLPLFMAATLVTAKFVAYARKRKRRVRCESCCET
jgi:hypothetical protein